MSVKRVAFHSVTIANNNRGGSFATRKTRTANGRQFVCFCLDAGYPLVDIGKIDVVWLKAWVAHLKTLNLSVATTNNKVASVRSLAAARGPNTKKNELSDSSALGLDKRNRGGTKEPITDEKFEAALQKATAMGEIGFVHTIRLERFLGLRGLESLMSTHALQKFAKQAKQLIGAAPNELFITDGTKGGRPRHTAVIGEYASETFTAILEALKFAKDNNGYLIQGKPNSGLGGARRRYHRIAAAVGLVGGFAPHSLRYRYCVDKLIELRDADVPKNEAEGLLSQWLGHSWSRGTYINKVYGASVTQSYPKTKRVQNIQNVIRELTSYSATVDPLDAP